MGVVGVGVDMESDTDNGETEQGGRFGRTPYKPEDLLEEYPTTDSGRLVVSCVGCGKEWYPTTKCCVDRYAGDPFCPNCGTDFRRTEKVWDPKVVYYSPEELAEGNGGTEVTEAVKTALDALDTAHENFRQKRPDDTDGTYPVWQARKALKNAFGELEPAIRSEHSLRNGRDEGTDS